MRCTLGLPAFREVTVTFLHGCEEYGSQRERGAWVCEDPRLMHSG